MAEQPMPAPEQSDAPDAGQGQPPQGAKGASPMQVISEIHAGLMQLNDMVGSTDVVSPEEKQMLGQIIAQFQSFADGLAQPSEGAASPSSAPKGGPVPVNGMPGKSQPVM